MLEVVDMGDMEEEVGGDMEEAEELMVLVEEAIAVEAEEVTAVGEEVMGVEDMAEVMNIIKIIEFLS